MAFVQENDFVIIKNIEEINDRQRLYQMLRKTADILDGILSNYCVFKYYIAVGRIVDSYHQAHLSFRDTADAIAVASALNLPHTVIRPEDVTFSLLADKLPEELRCSKIETALEAFDNKSADLVLGLFECFENFINNGFCIANTASAMFLHRNTVKKRLAKIKELTGFDPNGSFYDIFIIVLIYQHYLTRR
jgi:sugar diacid utilization regulator